LPLYNQASELKRIENIMIKAFSTVDISFKHTNADFFDAIKSIENISPSLERNLKNNNLNIPIMSVPSKPKQFDKNECG
jgi:hypothetical protein